MSFDDTSGRHAVRDYYEDCTIHIEERQPEGREIGPCKKCKCMIWIHAPRCKHCGYDPAVEQARLEALYQQRRKEEMQWLHRAFTLAAFVIFFVGFPIAIFGLGLKGNDVIRAGTGIGVTVLALIGAVIYWPQFRSELRL